MHAGWQHHYIMLTFSAHYKYQQHHRHLSTGMSHFGADADYQNICTKQ